MSEYGPILEELRAIRAEQTTQGKLLAAVDERTQNMQSSIKAHLDSDEEFHDGIEKRVSSLEHFRTKVIAKIGTYAAAIGFAVAFIGDMVKGWLGDWIGRA